MSVAIYSRIWFVQCAFFVFIPQALGASIGNDDDCFEARNVEEWQKYCREKNSCLFCKLCHKKYCRKDTFKHHFTADHTAKGYICPQCGLSCTGKYNLRRHMGVRNCRQRNKSLKGKAYLKTGFYCLSCESKFRTRFELLQHKKTFDEETCLKKYHQDYPAKKGVEKRKKKKKSIKPRNFIKPVRNVDSQDERDKEQELKWNSYWKMYWEINGFSHKENDNYSDQEIIIPTTEEVILILSRDFIGE